MADLIDKCNLIANSEYLKKIVDWLHKILYLIKKKISEFS